MWIEPSCLTNKIQQFFQYEGHPKSIITSFFFNAPGNTDRITTSRKMQNRADHPSAAPSTVQYSNFESDSIFVNSPRITFQTRLNFNILNLKCQSQITHNLMTYTHIFYFLHNYHHFISQSCNTTDTFFTAITTITFTDTHCAC